MFATLTSIHHLPEMCACFDGCFIHSFFVGNQKCLKLRLSFSFAPIVHHCSLCPFLSMGAQSVFHVLLIWWVKREKLTSTLRLGKSARSRPNIRTFICSCHSSISLLHMCDNLCVWEHIVMVGWIIVCIALDAMYLFKRERESMVD